MEVSDLIGKSVYVYYNIRKRTFSVRYKGKVVCHTDSIYIDSPTFKVNDAGRQRVIRDKRKNVHAYVVGVVCKPREIQNLAQVSYNPYENASFVYKWLGLPIRNAQIAHLINGKIFVGYNDTTY